MIAMIQRVSKASVTVNNKIEGQIDRGFLVLLGVSAEDTKEDARYLAGKIAGLRIFEDENEKMNLSLLDVGGQVLVISNFTLCADCRSGKRPSFVKAARPEDAMPLYQFFVRLLREAGISKVETGVFGASMDVALHNDGPVTIYLDSKLMKESLKK